MKPTDIHNSEYFHKVIDCQYACPAHTPVPEYIRMIDNEEYEDAYMVNWVSNVFPGILGRICDRPCEPACRRGRIDEEPVAICRLKRVTADNKTSIADRLPEIPKKKNGKRIALIGGGPASLTVARDLMPLGYEVDLYDDQDRAGGFIRTQVPSFRLPEKVLNEEINYILDFGVNTIFNHYVSSLKEIIDKDYDAIFVGTGSPRGRDLPDLPGRQEGDEFIHIGIEWLAAVLYRHVKKVGNKVLVLGGGNTAMDCCRTARRLDGESVKVMVRSPREEMKASPWEIEDAEREDIEIIDNHAPLEFVIENGKLIGMKFDRVEAKYDDKGKRSLVSTGEEPVFIECDEVLLAVGQQNAYPWIERDIGLEFNEWDMPVVNEVTFQSTIPKVFFGGDAAFGPRNVITAVAHGHHAAISIDMLCQGKDLNDRPHPSVNLTGQKMGIHDWIYDSHVTEEDRQIVPMVDKVKSIQDRLIEVELGFDHDLGQKEAKRCLNCDIQTVFIVESCIECDACVDICPVTCINFIENGEEDGLRARLTIPAQNLTQDLYVSSELPTGRVMVKDENVCLHCGLCAERCPTAAWEMVKFIYKSPQAGIK
ncbi:FAD-dependent oxidoreductase [Desulfosediminicola flagellatus]|uniref:FAD-dependent oxidoreductase n=1 Tax=Desulfosediminicola flagellatus TaxID=2569541 RepID=UPI0010AB72E7|nr:FAD-dependent oxidoreductase [Desulfosediminicola flagellatus]